MKMKKIIVIGCGIFLNCFLGIAGAMDATMTPPVVDFQGRELLVSSTVDVDFNSRLKEALDSGMDITFFFTMELYRIRSWWWDENMFSLPVIHTVKYDNLKKVYHISTGGEEIHRTVRDYQEMKEEILLLNSVSIDLPENLENSPEEKYYMRIMSEMPSLDPPFLFFSSNEFSTPWVESGEFSLPFSSPSLTKTSPEEEKVKKEGVVP